MTGTKHQSTATNVQHARSRDRGSTFIELLVSVVLLGVAGVAVLAAIAATATGADAHRQISDGQSWRATITDALTDVDSVYRDCVTEPSVSNLATYYETNIIAPITAGAEAPVVDIIDIQFWDSVSDTFISSCQYAAGDRLQRLTVQTTSRTETKTLSVVKRPALPPTQNTQPGPGPVPGGAVIPTPTPGLTGP